MSVLRAAVQLAQKDLRIELRSREILVTTALFAVLIVIMASLALYTDPVSAPQIAPGVLWIAIVFAGVLAMARSWGREREGSPIDGLIVAPIPRAAIYLGKFASTLVFLALVQCILVPLTALLFHLDVGAVVGRLIALLALGSIGFAAAGCLFSVMSVRTRARELMLSVVIFPLVTPALLCGAVATKELLSGASMMQTLGWLRILAAFDVLFLTAGVVLFETLASE